jgi:quercetin 2,3-dioxygenase
MLTLRKSEERGHANLDWLDSYHTFSFSNYYDPRHMGFRNLRVINQDKVAPSEGFGTHPHRDMEIISYVLDGVLAHKDSMGNGSTIESGDVQTMTAGTGVTHSEFNPNEDAWVHFLQIWVLPDAKNLKPNYDQKNFSREEKLNQLRLVASKDGRDGSLTINQNVDLYATILEPEKEVTYTLAPSRYGWVHVATGKAFVNGQLLGQGDGVAITEEATVSLRGEETAEILFFDLN